MEAASASVAVSSLRHGSQAEEQKLCGQGSPDQKVTLPCQGGRQRRALEAEPGPCGEPVVVTG